MFEILQELNLSEYEVKIYVTLVKIGTMAAFEISKSTSINRVRVYDKLVTLQNKGLVSSIQEGKKKLYQATSPQKLLDILEEKDQEFEKTKEQLALSISKLNDLQSVSQYDTHVQVFRGREGLKFVLKDVVREKKTLSISFIDDQMIQNILPDFMPQYFREMTGNKIKERVITLRNKEVFEYDKEIAPYAEYRYLDATEFNPTNTLIYGNKVALITWGTPLVVILIENNQVANTYLDAFNHLWRIADKKK